LIKRPYLFLLNSSRLWAESKSQFPMRSYVVSQYNISELIALTYANLQHYTKDMRLYIYILLYIYMCVWLLRIQLLHVFRNFQFVFIH
jgi:hypothetical protein